MTGAQLQPAQSFPASWPGIWGRAGTAEYHAPAHVRRRCPMTEPPPEAESSCALVIRARAGDDGALEELCVRYLPRLRRWAHGRLPSWARGTLETQDLAQEALIQAVRHLGTFEPRHEGAFQAYLRRTMLNRIRDEIRRVRRRGLTRAFDGEEPAMDPSPLEEAIGQEMLARYESALHRLRPEDREAIVMRIELGYEYPDVAAALGKPTIAAAHMAVSRALVKLAKEMAHAR